MRALLAKSSLNLSWPLLVTLCYALSASGEAHAQYYYMERAPIRDPARIFRSRPWSYKELKERQVVMQKLDYSCGAATLATIAKYYWGDNVGEEKFIHLIRKLGLTEAEIKDRIEKGLTLTDLRDLANLAGYEASMGKVEFSELAQAKVPVIVGITVNKHDHFVVFRGTDNAWAYLADPIRGNIRTPIPLFLEQWQKNAILVFAKPDTEVKTINPMGIRVDEIERTVLNDFTVNKDAMTPVIPMPIRFFP